MDTATPGSTPCGLDMVIVAGGMLGLSGNGKSTLLNILGGLDQPTERRVRFRQTALTTPGGSSLPPYRREHVGFVFQFCNLVLGLTARKNVALELVGLSGRLHPFPARFSGRELQRGAIARTIAKRLPVWFCDGSTRALDIHTGIRLLQAIAIGRRCDRYVEIADGLPEADRIGSHPREKVRDGDRIAVAGNPSGTPLRSCGYSNITTPPDGGVARPTTGIAAQQLAIRPLSRRTPGAIFPTVRHLFAETATTGIPGTRWSFDPGQEECTPRILYSEILQPRTHRTMPLTRDELRQLEASLRARLHTLREELRIALARSGNEKYQTIVGQVSDLKDAAFAQMVMGLNLADADRDAAEVVDIQAALKRLAEHRYGVCGDCGEPIPEARLRAYPSAKRCYDCQQIKEARGGRS